MIGRSVSVIKIVQSWYLDYHYRFFFSSDRQFKNWNQMKNAAFHQFRRRWVSGLKSEDTSARKTRIVQHKYHLLLPQSDYASQILLESVILFIIVMLGSFHKWFCQGYGVNWKKATIIIPLKSQIFMQGKILTVKLISHFKLHKLNFLKMRKW